MEKVIITGANGFLGSSLALRLLEAGVTVIGIGSDNHGFEEIDVFPQFRKYILKFEDYLNIPEIIEDRDIDVFFHFAWAGGFTTAIRDYKLQMSNAGYAGDAIVVAYELKCKKFVHAGTYNEFEIQTFLASNTFEPRWTCIYSIGKTAADLICKTLAYNLGIEYNIAFIPMPYGRRNYSRQLANVVIDSLNKGIAPKLVEGNNTYDLVYIDDLVEGVIAIAEQGVNQRGYYIGHRTLKTFKEWMIDIRDVLSPETELKFGEYEDAQNIDYSLIDLDALYRDTGFECKADFRSSIHTTSEWVKGLNWQTEGAP